ncbi:MAG: hypothetical protein KatS3mg105_3607 [Gemmatales bacterium]|nr:MAG: hypothetical protein KatS3mg105_3607 [Gemmatales bacterium]
MGRFTRFVKNAGKLMAVSGGSSACNISVRPVGQEEQKGVLDSWPAEMVHLDATTISLLTAHGFENNTLVTVVMNDGNRFFRRLWLKVTATSIYRDGRTLLEGKFYRPLSEPQLNDILAGLGLSVEGIH